jgi:dihydropyrimidinase
MVSDTALVGGTIVTPNGKFEANLGIRDGKIAVIQESVPDTERVVDVTNMYVFPGIVDPHTHFHGYYSEDTYKSATAAAALGGVTTCINFAWQPWASTGPSSNSIWEEDGTVLEAVREQKARGEAALVDFGLHGGITRESQEFFEELDDVIDEGITSFKMFTAYEQGVSNGYIDRVFRALAERDAIAVMHTENQSVIDALTRELRSKNRTDSEWYPASRPPRTESMAADDALRMAQNAGVKYYGLHTSNRETADVIRAYQKDGTRVRSETCTHYTALTRDVYEGGNLAIIAPPLRGEDDVDAMFEHLRDGSLSVVSTDHVAFSRERKMTDAWWNSTFGANSLQQSLPVFHDVAINERGFSYPSLIRVMSTNPARTFGFPEKGTLEIGTDADLVVFDPNKEYTISASDDVSNADFSIYDNRTVRGSVEKTFVRGTLVADEGSVVAPPDHGSFVYREPVEWQPLTQTVQK